MSKRGRSVDFIEKGMFTIAGRETFLRISYFDALDYHTNDSDTHGRVTGRGAGAVWWLMTLLFLTIRLTTTQPWPTIGDIPRYQSV